MEGFHRRVAARLQQLSADGLYRQPRVVQALPGGRCLLSGQELINFGGNDYLGLAHRVTLASAPPLTCGSTASAAVMGRSPELAALEAALADFEDTPAALVFPTGYAANLGVLQTLVEAGDAVLCDRDNHASIVDACRTAQGQFLVYRGDRLAALEQTLARRRARYDQVFLVTDGVFSMDGTVARLPELCELAARFDACVIVDEAHGTGVLGERGRGATEHTHTEDRVLLRIGTLSKATGGLGGFVVGPQDTIDWLRNRARTQFFSTALPPAMCQAMTHSLQQIVAQPERRHQLGHLRQLAHQLAAAHGLQTIPGGVAPIIPILVGEPDDAVRLSQQLQDAGFFVPAIRPPTVPAGTARLRLSLCADHTRQQVEDVMSTIARLWQT